MIAADELARFCAVLARALGWRFAQDKHAWLSEVMQRRLAARRVSAVTYLYELEHNFPSLEQRALAEELTIGETYFFRHYDQFRAFADLAIANGERHVRVLSAGCASGEEPYSLAMMVRELADRYPELRATIVAIDVNPAALERARVGNYSAWSLRETSDERQRRWFAVEGRERVLDATIRASVRFAELNLAEPSLAAHELLMSSAYDVVFCRNVLMYFTAEQTRAVLARLTRALRPNGYLFLGHAETLRGVSSSYELMHTHETFYYQRRGNAADLPLRGVGEAVPSSTSNAPWVDIVQRSADRIAAMALAAETPSLAPPPTAATSSAPHAVSIADIVEQLRLERYAAALALLARLPTERAKQRDVRLLHAALLTHSGELARAEIECRALIAEDELNASAHYLLALCSDGTGNREAAINHDQVAAYLDPTFVMPLLHLGLLARRAGDREGARRELKRALELLPHEDPERLAWFGGGFGRPALEALCRAELEALV